MNTILHQKRNVNFFIAAGLTLALVVVAVFAIATSATKTSNIVPSVSQITGNKESASIIPLSADAFPQYRQSEWQSNPVLVGGFSPEQLQREYILGERYGALPDQNASLIAEQKIHREYILGERYGVMPEKYTLEQALREYWLGERYGQTPIGSLNSMNGLEQYHQSERSSIPVQFTPYQISEWFGK